MISSSCTKRKLYSELMVWYELHEWLHLKQPDIWKKKKSYDAILRGSE